MTDLREFIHGFAKFSDEGWNALRSIARLREFEKGEHLIEAGKIHQSLFFISKGFCRAYHVQDGGEINTNFYFEKEIVTHMNGYVNDQQSTFAVQACEPVIAYEFYRDDVFEISKRVPEIGIIGKRSLELIAAKQEQQIELYRLLTAGQRYEHLQKHQPEMLQRVSLTQLSSYLGVARETLSRIRRKKTS